MHNLIRATYWTIADFIQGGAAALCSLIGTKKAKDEHRLLKNLQRNRLGRSLKMDKEIN